MSYFIFGFVAITNEPLAIGKRNLVWRLIITTPVSSAWSIVYKSTTINVDTIRNF
jgi:hypothetical protein